ncbi:hypothetical protein BU16DRAFT_300953 [Lophium mytilinum]|uniref:Uncharacterized protein n=1 Tax=Lophium mytilinum TaxID=390894 RepID=A0A6A6R268_9PEZI|nr:hypothetical protein BU16DRAFT_300953 [Lophium mytilinum]
MDLPSSGLSDPPSSPASCGQPAILNIVTDRKRSFAEMVDTRQSKNGRAREPIPTRREERSQSPTLTAKGEGRSSPDSQTTQRQILSDENDAPELNGAEATEPVDPAEKIEDFDWGNLEERYHDAMDKNIDVEQRLTEEWDDLMNFFSIWQEASKHHEVDRSFRRLRTRTAHVQNSEENLEKTRVHYIQVVRAFESALDLLNTR